MIVTDFIHQFILMNKRTPAHGEELVQYLQDVYSYGDVTLIDYMTILHALYKHEAVSSDIMLLEHA